MTVKVRNLQSLPALKYLRGVVYELIGSKVIALASAHAHISRQATSGCADS